MATLIDGKAIAAKVRAEAKAAVAVLKAERGVTPGLATVLVGNNAASKTYVTSKHKACADAGLASWQHDLPETIGQGELLALVDKLNRDPAVHGILVQLPLPDAIDENAVIASISPAKDVDAFHPENAGRLLTGLPGPRPCTPAGIIRLLDEVGCDPKGKNAVVVGRSNIVGKPMALLLLERHATVTICHSRTADLAAEVGRGDILVVAIGKARAIAGSWVKPGAVVIDVGMNRDQAGKLCGDVDFETAKERASAITPVPGGVGPMTVAMLVANTVAAARQQTERVSRGREG
jgi:methylenetetrahydrofolate dehydrogenase (NADP+) / methenyltetrahydrofolate cyclohydrolase